MTEQITAIVVPADATVAPYMTTVNGLSDFQRLVGGWIQPVDGPGWTAYLDEEGKLKHRPANDRAHHFVHWVSPAGLAAWDTIVGDVVFVGPVNAEGDNTDAPQVLAAHFGVTAPAA